MGFIQDIMQGFVQKEISRRFPGHDGWTCSRVASGEDSVMIFRLSRYHRGRTECAYLTASLGDTVSPGQAALVDAIPGDPSCRARFMLVPQGADVSLIPAGVTVIPMTSFCSDHGEVVWRTRKKNAMRCSPLEIAQ